MRSVRGGVFGLLWVIVSAGVPANVVTDWDAQAVSLASFAAVGQRELVLVHVAMFDAVNSIEQRYQPYLVEMEVDSATSPEAAAASAAATVLRGLHPQSSGQIDAALKKSLAAVKGDAAARSAGVKLGAAVAAKVLDARRQDVLEGPDPFRVAKKAGEYLPTMTMYGVAWPALKPFAMSAPSQFRPGPPLALDSEEWAENLNEVKELGAKNSRRRSDKQTETARFWLMVGTPAYHPIARQIVSAKQMSVIDSARFMALYSVALADAYVSVFDAKYHYSFWRPVTAIYNAEMDGNPATERDPLWQPIADTPMHPEYPCAHCIQAGAAVGVIQALWGPGPVGRLELTSTAAPGVTHSWTRPGDFSDEVSNARIWAGFHYRFSARVGTDMGLKIGEFVVQNVMKPRPTAASASRTRLE
jgi:hypothetical protein